MLRLLISPTARRATRLLAASFLVTVLGFAVAQDPATELPDFVLDPAAWFEHPLAWASAVFALVGILKEHVLTTLRGWQTIALSFGLGIVGAIVATFTPYFDASIGDAVVFGLSAAVAASGIFDGAKGAIRKGSAEAPHVVNDLPPSRKD